MEIFYDAINRYSDPLLMFPLLNHIQIISWAISLVYRLKYLFSFVAIFIFKILMFYFLSLG